MGILGTLGVLAEPLPSGTLGGLRLGMERAQVPPALGPATSAEPDGMAWERTLWTAPEPDADPPAMLQVRARLSADFVDDRATAVQATLLLDDRLLAALCRLDDLPADPVWVSDQGIGLGATLGQLLEAYGDPSAMPGLPTEDGAGFRAPTEAELDDAALDLRWRLAPSEWLLVLVRDLDPRAGHVSPRVTGMRLERMGG